MKKVIFVILFFANTSFGISSDEILKGVEGFIQSQEQAFSSYTARVRVEMVMDNEKEKGGLFATGSVSFKRPDSFTTKIDEMKGAVKKEDAQAMIDSPMGPFEIYDIFKEGHSFKYDREDEKTYWLFVFPKKGCDDAVKGKIGINKDDFAISFVDVETSSVNLGLFSCKMKLKEKFFKVEGFYVPEELVIETKMRMLIKKMDMKTEWSFSDYKF